MDFLDKLLERIQSNNEMNAAASITGIDSPHTNKKPLRYYDKENEQEELEEDENEPLDNRKTIMIDVDKTIHEYSEGWKDGTLYDIMIPGAKEAIDELSKDYEIVIFTSRLSAVHDESEIERQKELLSEWLINNEIYYDDMTADKRPASYYVDDKSIKFEGDWNEVLRQIKSTEGEE